MLQLSKLLPFGKQIIIITDGGFSTPWFNEVKKRGWDYIGRINRNMNILIKDKWLGTTLLSKEASFRVKYIGTGKMGRKVKSPVMASIYTLKQKSKHRKDKSNFPSVNKRYSKIQGTWVLATSLCPILFKGNAIKNIYKKRMQIEQNFRDDKNARWGLGWRSARTYDVKRIPVLCLIASIAIFLLWWIGLIAENMNLHRRFQVNSEKKKRVLSLPHLGKQVLFHYPFILTKIDWHEAPRKLISTYEEKILWC